MDLLVAMGYGGSVEDAGKVVGKSGDGGIDGIIKQDKLGLDAIYVQAKRWKDAVGSPEIMKFSGSLTKRHANRGVFITTSTFTKDASEFVEAMPQKIVLIDGKEPTDVKPGVPTDSLTTLRLPAAEIGRPVAAIFNQERIVARAWPASENRIAIAELTY